MSSFVPAKLWTHAFRQSSKTRPLATTIRPNLAAADWCVDAHDQVILAACQPSGFVFPAARHRAAPAAHSRRRPFPESGMTSSAALTYPRCSPVTLPRPNGGRGFSFEPSHGLHRQMGTGGLRCPDLPNATRHHSAWRRCAFGGSIPHQTTPACWLQRAGPLAAGVL